MSTRQWLTALAMLLMCAGLTARADEAVKDPAAQAARAWLTAADAGDGQKSWELAAPVFQRSITAQRWQEQLAAVRGPLGAVKARGVPSISHTNSLPGAPDGDYAVMHFDTQFEHKAAAVETLIALKQPDGSWRVAGYFIK
jgi:hypothetical protein